MGTRKSGLIFSLSNRFGLVAKIIEYPVNSSKDLKSTVRREAHVFSAFHWQMTREAKFGHSMYK
jgi:Holliday junction resolvasome RuvABC ATP-dependent DNA helicase subunit